MPKVREFLKFLRQRLGDSGTEYRLPFDGTF